MNLKQGKMNINKYELKFTKLYLYTPEFLSKIRSRMRKFTPGLSLNLVLKCKDGILNHDRDMDISRSVVYMQLVEDEKKK